MKVYFVYEGRLGSTRADSTYVLENAEVSKSLAQVAILNSRRKNWEIPPDVLNDFGVISLGRAFNPKNLFQSIKGQLMFGFAVRKFLKERAQFPCVLIFHNWWALQALHGIRSNRSKFQLVLEVHDQLPLRKLWPRMFFHVDLFVATNKYKYMELERHFREKLMLEKNCVRISRYKKSQEVDRFKISAEVPSGSILLGYTGSFGPEKNPMFIAKCALKLSDFFVIAGNIPSHLHSTYTSLDNITLLGPKPREDIPLIQKSCDALIITLDPSSKQSNLYTSTMKLMEYVAARKPILAPNLPSILELLDEEEFYPFDAESVDSFLTAVEKLKWDLGRGVARMPKPERIKEYSWVERNKRILAKCTQNLLGP